MNAKRKARSFSVVILALAICSTLGCFGPLHKYISMKNDSKRDIVVTSEHTGNSFAIGPGKERRIPHGSGGLEIASEGGADLKFSNIDPMGPEKEFSVQTMAPFALEDSVTVFLSFNENDQLQVLDPKRKKIPALNQPQGYPKQVRD